jgi:hypothetical protein
MHHTPSPSSRRLHPPAPSRWRLPWALALCALLSAALTAGCGDDDAAQDPAQDPSADASADATNGTASDAFTDAADASAPIFAAVPCSACFPLEDLDPRLRTLAEEILLDALDAEALYSIAADIKPMSTGFLEISFPAADGDSAQAQDMRAILAAFNCGPALSAGLQVFTTPFDGELYADGVIFNGPRFAQTLTRYPDLFAAIGVTPDMSPLEVVQAVDADPTTRRFRAYGLLFGYPEHAVDFFVSAVEQEEATGEFVARDFFQIPTFVSDTGRFVYAVPKGHTPTPEDEALRARALQTLDAYKALRADMVGSNKPGALALARRLFDDGSGQCSPERAWAASPPSP